MQYIHRASTCSRVQWHLSYPLAIFHLFLPKEHVARNVSYPMVLLAAAQGTGLGRSQLLSGAKSLVRLSTLRQSDQQFYPR